MYGLKRYSTSAKTLCVTALTLLLGTTAPALAQSVFLSGEVVEKGTTKHLPFSIVCVPGEHTGTKADQRGYFRVPMISNGETDTLLVMAAGYYPQKVPIQRSEASTWVSAELVKKPVALSRTPNQTTAGSMRNVTMGSQQNRKGDGMMQGYPGTQYAFWIKNDDDQYGVLKSVSYFVDALGFPSEPFRVRVYRALPNNGGPGEELLTDKVVVSAPQGGQWYTVDLSKYYIALPPQGVFIAMEWLVAGESFVADNSGESYTPYGQILSPTYEFPENRTWNYTVGKKWKPLTSYDPNRVMNAMMKAEVTLF